jgi:hypothetical protein
MQMGTQAFMDPGQEQLKKERRGSFVDIHAHLRGEKKKRKEKGALETEEDKKKSVSYYNHHTSHSLAFGIGNQGGMSEVYLFFLILHFIVLDYILILLLVFLMFETCV